MMIIMTTEFPESIDIPKLNESASQVNKQKSLMTTYAVPYFSSGFIPDNRLRALAQNFNEAFDDLHVLQLYDQLKNQLEFQNNYQEPHGGSETNCNDANLNHIMIALAALINHDCKCMKRSYANNDLKIVKSCNPEYCCEWDKGVLVVSEAKGFTDSHCNCWVSLLS